MVLLFETKEELEVYVKIEKKLRKEITQKPGKELDLFLIDEKVVERPSMWTPKGTAVKFAMEDFARKLEKSTDMNMFVRLFGRRRLV